MNDVHGIRGGNRCLGCVQVSADPLSAVSWDQLRRQYYVRVMREQAGTQTGGTIARERSAYSVHDTRPTLISSTGIRRRSSRSRAQSPKVLLREVVEIVAEAAERPARERKMLVGRVEGHAEVRLPLPQDLRGVEGQLSSPHVIFTRLLHVRVHRHISLSHSNPCIHQS